MSTTDSYDAIVVGGGPGGASAAYHLATGGARVLLVEKSTYPREKVCGDGLTPLGTAALDAMGLTDAYADWPRNVGLRVHGGGHSLELPWPEVSGQPSFGLTQRRIDLDHLLVKQAVKAGATLMTSTDVLRPLVERGQVVGAELQPFTSTDTGDGRRAAKTKEDPFDVRADLLIAADGASSRIGQALGHRRDEKRPIAVAMRAYYRTERDEDPWIDSYLTLRSGDELLPGYGWVFPMGDGTVNVGVGLLNTSKGFANTNYRKLLADWAPTAGRDWGYTAEDEVGPALSRPLPMGANRHPGLWRGVLFVGDAAGMINPFNGEGISYAMETGEMAARTALDVLASGDRSRLSNYSKALVERYGSYYTLGRTFVKLIGQPQVMRLCTTLGMAQPRLMHLVLKLLGNLYEPAGGTASDRIVAALNAAAPAR